MDNIYYKKRQCCFDEHSRICDDDRKRIIEYEEAYTCCFFGHRKIDATENLYNEGYAAVEKLIRDCNVNTFIFGSKSEFNDLCHKIVTNLKEKYPHIKRIYVRSAFQHIPDWYEDSLLKHYEDTYFPEHMENAGRASYVERNQEIINLLNYI